MSKSLKIVKQLGGFSTSFKNPTKFVIFPLNQLNKYLWNMLRIKFFPFSSFFFSFLCSQVSIFGVCLREKVEVWAQFNFFYGHQIVGRYIRIRAYASIGVFLVYGFGGWKYTGANEATSQRWLLPHTSHWRHCLDVYPGWLIYHEYQNILNLSSLLMSSFKVNKCPILLVLI